ncbi:antitoxin TumA [Thermodesulfobacteriota bacterium]
MRKHKIEYDSPVDALVAVTKRLSIYEGRYYMESEEFFDKFTKGQTEDSKEFVEWANDYQHYMALRQEVDTQLRHAG